METAAQAVQKALEGIPPQDRKSIPKSSTPQSGWNEDTGTLETPPRVKPEFFPEEIFRHFLQEDEISYEEKFLAVWTYLEGYKKSGVSWEDYVVRARIPLEFREKMARIFSECRRNGFLSPSPGFSRGKKVILFRQLVSPVNETPQSKRLEWKRCDLCERSCPSKDWKGFKKEGSDRCGTMDSNRVTISG